MGRVDRWEGGRWKDDFWNGFPKDLTSLAAASERGRLRCSSHGSPAGCLDLPAGSHGSVSKEATSAWQLWKYFIKIKSSPAWRSFGSFQSNNKEFRSYFPCFGMQRSKFDLTLAICFHFCKKRSLQDEAVLMTFTANSWSKMSAQHLWWPREPVISCGSGRRAILS